MEQRSGEKDARRAAENALIALWSPGRWVQRHMVTFWVGFVTWIFFGNTWQAFLAGAAVETVDWYAAQFLVTVDYAGQPVLLAEVVRDVARVDRGLAQRIVQARDANRWADLVYRWATVVVGIFMAIFVAWAGGFAAFEGKRRFGAWVVIMLPLIPTRAFNNVLMLWVLFFSQFLAWLVTDIGELYSAETTTRVAVAVFFANIAIITLIATTVTYPISDEVAPVLDAKGPPLLGPAAFVWMTMISAWGVVVLIWWAVEMPDVSELERLI